MYTATTTKTEAREKALAELKIMDTAPEPEFDELVELAAAICGVPISLISLVDRDRQWFKSAVGLEKRETPIEAAFCAHAIQQDGLFVVEDAVSDTRFVHNDLVTGEPHLRFYAGMPLTMQDGCAIGTLCVIDRKPRILTEQQKRALGVLSRQVEARLEMRSQRLALEASLREQRELARSLRASEDIFRTFMNNSPHVNYIKDADGRLLFYNRAFAEQLGVTMDECLGKLDRELWPEKESAVFRAHDLEVLAGGVRVEDDEEITNRYGRLMCFRSTKFPYQDRDGKSLLAGISIDVTEEAARKNELLRYQAEVEAANKRLQELSITDPLTGLRNRRAFDERLAVEFANARRVGRDLSMIMIDVDNFKRINDERGHGVGDDVLREIARLLERTVRQADLAARYGGEEFAVLLPGSSIAQAICCAERLRDALRFGRFEFGPVTVSMGVASMAAGCIAGEMVACADEALYAAKRGGKDHVIAHGLRTIGEAQSGPVSLVH